MSYTNIDFDFIDSIEKNHDMKFGSLAEIVLLETVFGLSRTQEFCTMSKNSLAKRLRVSRASCFDIISKFEKQGILTRAITPFGKLGKVKMTTKWERIWRGKSSPASGLGSPDGGLLSSPKSAHKNKSLSNKEIKKKSLKEKKENTAEIGDLRNAIELFRPFAFFPLSQRDEQTVRELLETYGHKTLTALVGKFLAERPNAKPKTLRYLADYSFKEWTYQCGAGKIHLEDKEYKKCACDYAKSFSARYGVEVNEAGLKSLQGLKESKSTGLLSDGIFQRGGVE